MRTRTAKALSILAVLLGLGSLLAPASALAEFGILDVNDGAGPAPEAPAFDGDRAIWSGTCDLSSADTTHDGVGSHNGGIEPPPTRAHCIDPGASSISTPDSPWPTGEEPRWRLDSVSQAGAHPDASAAFFFEKKQGSVELDDHVKDVVVRLPPGVVGSPTATPRCPAVIVQFTPPLCPAETQVGVALLVLDGEMRTQALTNAEARDTITAEFVIGNVTTTFNIPISARGRTNGDYGVDTLSLLIPTAKFLHGAVVTLWGVSWAVEHDKWRIDPIPFYNLDGPGNATFIRSIPPDGIPEEEQAKYDPSWGPIEPFFSNPTRCTQTSLPVGFDVDSWENPGAKLPGADRGVPDLSDPDWKSYDVEPPPVDDCDKLSFEPSIALQPTVDVADSPSGLDVTLETPQNEALPFDPPAEGASQEEIDDYVAAAADYWRSDAGLATAHLKDTTVSLPQGTSFNAAAANGLQGCTTEQIGLTQISPQILFNNDKVRCPDSSQVGTLRIDTPLLPDPLFGRVYAAPQGDNPFPGSLTSIYLVAQDDERGLSVKLPGKVDLDPATGQIGTTFLDNPQLPFNRFTLHFKAGPRAPLATPATCGQYRNRTVLTPWSGGAASVLEDPFEIGAMPAPFACVSEPEDRAFEPGFDAGTTTTQAGGETSFALNVTRRDGEQEVSALGLDLAPGIVADLTRTPYCPEAAIAAVASRSGQDETGSPSCPEASRIGSVDSLAGAGSLPLPTAGELYLAGPYQGAPLSALAVVPAIAGGTPGDPAFDLGNVAIRTPVEIDPRTATVHVAPTPVPRIVSGVPLRLRRASVHIDKPGFMRNPTNCSELRLGAGIGGGGDPLDPDDDVLATPSSRFQVGNCAALGFKPSLRLRLRGGTRRADHPRLIATLTAREGDANIARAQVTMPRSEFLDQAHIRTVCTRVQFAADACPAGSIYGYAEASTPLLSEPLRGAVYLRSSENPLPDLVADLRGPAHQPIRVELIGRTDSVRGALRNTFDVVPDAPVSRFTLRLQGGKRGLLVNSRDICVRPYRATIRLGAQNGRRLTLRPKLAADCKKRRAAKRRHRSHRHRADGRR